ncbi:ATP-NAD kinase-like domain-containing protein [Dunaliella salina]|uniref:ATP-NAD kinase-like domain-containing protein n=1 Tax=Dunaliella salina TaxID=3046 RepID=A0ABQ7GF10_DUNSA|nr:ATP-NAD kinase-like domain-containing protein [Dunaliella salina]|eukprot:KAF5833187.1 ATP-NAD kinase-like domain-containing protein [Dunaliella salina]
MVSRSLSSSLRSTGSGAPPGQPPASSHQVATSAPRDHPGVHLQAWECSWRVAVVNPTSGQGKGSSIFSKQVLPLLRDVAGLSVEVHATVSKHHATQIVRDLSNIDKVDAILYVGGDGTVFEGLQGLLSRPDWVRAATVPFATCPTGSGNGLAASLGVFDPVAAAFTVTRRRQHPVDVASVLQPHGSRYFLLLSLAYGLMSNLDIGTEHLRWMGEPRFSWGGLCEVLGGRTYPLRAAVWPGALPIPQGTMATNNTTTQDASEPSLLSAASPLDVRVSWPPEAAANSTSQSNRLGGEGAEGAHTEKSSLLGHQKSAMKANSSSEPAAGFPQGSPPGFNEDVDVEAGRGGALSCSCLQGPPLPILSAMGGRLPTHLPSSQSQLPPGWKLIPEEKTCKAQYFMAHNTQYLALNARLNPKGLLSDGLWELITAQTSGNCIDKIRGLYMLLQTENGDHVNMDIVETQQMRALMLEPLSGDRTWTVLDGEAVDNLMTYLEVHPGLCRALVPPGWADEPKP